MAAKSTIINMASVLGGVCFVCAALLGCVYAVTAEPIEAASLKKTVDSISKVLPEGAEVQVEPLYGELDGSSFEYYCADVAGESVYAVKSTVNGFGGALTVMVGLKGDGYVVNATVLSHSETPGLGAKCGTDERFISQFRGLDPAQKTLKVRKDGGDIDAITASTITSRAYTLAIANAVEFIRSMGGNDNE